MRLFFDHYVRLVTSYPKAILLGIACLSIALAIGLPRFKLDASADSLTLENDVDLAYFIEMSKQYKSGDFLVVTFRPKDELFSDASLKLLGELKADLAQIPGVASINSILDVPLLYSPKQSVSDILLKPRTLLTPGVDRDMARQEFLNSPIYKEFILGPDAQTTALALNFAIDERYTELVQHRDSLRLKRKNEGLNAEESAELKRAAAEFLAYRTKSEAFAHDRVEKVREVVGSYKDRAQIFVGGLTMITADMITFIKNDLVVFGVAVVLFMIALLAFIFRSLRFVVIPMSVCLLAVLMMLGYVSWIDWRLTVISSNFVALLLIISLAIIIHLVVRYREYAAEHPDWNQTQLVGATVKFMARPCLYTALTTVVAFSSLVVSDIRPVIDFGWLMTMGLLLALGLAFIIMPATLVLLPLEKQKQAEQEATEHKPLTLYFSAIVEKHGNKVTIVSLIIAMLSIWGISRLDVENRFIDYFHKTTEIYQGLSVIDNNLGGTTTLDIIVSQQQNGTIDVAVSDSDFGDGEEDPFAEVEGEEDPFDEMDDEYADEEDPFAETDEYADDEEDPFAESGTGADKSVSDKNKREKNYWLTVAGLKRIEKIHDYLESLPEVGKVQSLAILYKVGKDLNGGLNDFELAIMERSLSEEVKGVLISPFVSPKASETRISLRIKDTYPGLKRKEFVDEIHAHLLNELNYKDEEVQLSGLLVLYNNMLQSLFKSQIVTLGVVFLGIMLMFVVLFQSLSVAIIAILPNILAALTVLGTMGILGLPLDMMTITVAAITVGIGVDDTIHYIHRFKEEIKVDGDYIAAMHRSHASIGRAMYYTSVIIIFGFSIMVLSEFIPTIYFGLLTGFAMFAALMGALLLLPKLIVRFRPFG